MGMKPFVSIIIVNFNGKHLLRDCLSSLLEISYPKDRFEVIVVDNNSNDDSVSYIKTSFPWVKLILSDVNCGFAGGNDLGLSHAIGEYIVLLNSDTKVDPLWLQEMVNVAFEKNVGIVNSKLYYWIPFLELTIQSSILPRADIVGNTDFSPLGVLLEDILTNKTHLNQLIWYGSGFYEKKKGEITLRWTRDTAKVLLPYELTETPNEYKLTIHGYPIDKPCKAEISIFIGTKKVISDEIYSRQVKEYKICIPPDEAEKHFVWMVQNAGNIVLKDGNGKDRGSVVLKKKGESIEFYERDSELFNKQSKLLAFCGASCLIKRKVIDTVGFLDTDYFMYYEDVDLSLRAWTAGYDIVYAPKSIVYHRHKATSKGQHDASMIYHLEKNYMALLLTYFPIMTIGIQYTRIFLRFILTYFKMLAYEYSDNISGYEEWRTKYQKRSQAIWYIIRASGRLLRKRIEIQQHSKRQFNSEGKIYQY